MSANLPNFKGWLLSTRRLEKKGDLDGAVKCYRHAVLEDPNSEVATRRLEAILTLQERQVCVPSRQRGGEEEEGGGFEGGELQTMSVPC